MANPGLSSVVLTAIEEYLLGGPREFSRVDVSERTGVPSEVTQRLWVALGFAATGDDSAREYAAADLTAIETFRGIPSFADLDIDRQTAVTRAVGQWAARLAEWQVDVVVDEIGKQVEVLLAADPDRDPADAAAAATATVMSAFEAMNSYVWRRHLAAALTRASGAPADDSAAGTTRRLAVGFADMVGFTRLTRRLDLGELTELLHSFEGITAEVIANNGGWVVKNLGDEVMFAADTPAAAVRIALVIQDAIRKADATPDLRTGIAYGEVLQRFGDLYGTVVNTAARLTGLARPGTVLVDDEAAAELAADPEFSVWGLRPVHVRGISRLRPHLVRRARVRQS
ncbi:adenylate/guanylate cyclase domain-containing protein [Nocardia stercoris]|uniref:Adenylate/guanylate cyclase domain-containing protein n=1 Tax=Nocardia stercoris TaxID=2483361 RepID=A0A3M2LAR1_9NOCA|nr:adenylate/guanylate cyclase domain-containing protein [Nocardia stercoris]RMI34116.1 adenylate/guanylate cyclase domain-containing protein [Nocardia stercoris]